MHERPAITSTQVSQLTLGSRVDLLSESGRWRQVRGVDGYVGWVHHGFLLDPDSHAAAAWERGAGADAVVSLGAELADQTGAIVARPPWGARLRGRGRTFRVPDGSSGLLTAGEIVPEAELADRFPPTGGRIAETAERWLGAPYLWGGVTPAGADCSGFVQAIFRMHGIALPRDSDLQASAGASITAGPRFHAPEPADLLFFAELDDRISHVAISLGGARIIHASLSNGGVAVNDMNGDRPNERELRRIFVEARRVCSPW